ncbi:MAG TPA: hypothetical protein VGG08_05170, partial [Solirubrobacteraceae bacterium]
IYAIDRLRLNPGGVPVRAVVYVLVAALAMLVLRRIPLIGAVIQIVPWFVWDLALPLFVGAAFSQFSIDGRPFHLAALSCLSFCFGPRELAGMRPVVTAASRWDPHDVVLIPEGSEARMRSFVYRGPGLVSVVVHGSLTEIRERRRLRFLGSSRPARRELVVSGADPSGAGVRRTFRVGEHATLRLLPGET